MYITLPGNEAMHSMQVAGCILSITNLNNNGMQHILFMVGIRKSELYLYVLHPSTPYMSCPFCKQASLGLYNSDCVIGVLHD